MDFGLHGLGQFLGVYFVRVHELPYSTAGALYGLQTFLSVGAGLLVGGSLAHRLGRRNLRWYSLIPAIGMFTCVPIYLVAFQATNLTVSVTLIILAGTSLVLHYGPGLAIVQNFATPRTRASTIALYMLVVNAVSMGLGPTLIGFMSDFYAGQVAQTLGAAVCTPGVPCLRAQGIGLQYALMTSTVFYAWGGLHYLLAQRSRAAQRTESGSRPRAAYLQAIRPGPGSHAAFGSRLDHTESDDSLSLRRTAYSPCDTGAGNVRLVELETLRCSCLSAASPGTVRG